MCRSINYLLIIFSFLISASCNQAVRPSSSTQKITPSQTTNDVAISNLDLAIAYMKQRSYEKALEKLEKAREADPDYSPTYNVFGLLYQTLGDYSKAENSFKKA